MSFPDSIRAIVETAIYVDDLSTAEHFYGQVLGLPVIAQEPGRHIFFRVGEGSVLLVFLAEATLSENRLPRHGTRGPGHFAMGINSNSLNGWREYLLSCHIAIEMEVDWPKGGHSVYFRDPAGNSVELLTPGVWGLPAGW